MSTVNITWKGQPGGQVRTWRGYVSGKWIATIKITPAGRFRRHWRERARRWLPSVEAFQAVSFDSYEEAVLEVQQWLDDFWLPESQARIKKG